MTGGGKRVTYLFADASFDERAQRAGWAMWARLRRRNIRRCGVVQRPGFVIDSCSAELAAIANGLFIAAQELQLGHGDVVVVRSDSKHAIELLGGFQALREDRSADAMVCQAVQELVAMTGLEILYRHVRGHRSPHNVPFNDRATAAINEWCDQRARAEIAASLAEDALRKNDVGFRARSNRQTCGQLAIA